ncbi:MAG TPA: DNA ligase D [Longimicrobiales bacterium]|nr:DNA ligase D [Longimicrobiales bacterium]
MPKPSPKRPDSLSEYHRKRSMDRTPEPSGGSASAAGNLYVIQKHAATRTHYDLRLELDGVLLSWAVPKTPSYDQADKRVAIHVEDHPVEYAAFEGVIPEGNYGAGPVIVWDRGVVVWIEDPHEGLEKGKLLFELRGYKLRGRWTLVKIRKAETEWLLIKERDGLEGPGREIPEQSVLSGLTVEQLGEGYDPAVPVLERLDSLGAPVRRVRASSVKPMLAEARKSAFSREGWVFELKYDGYRIIAGVAKGRAALLTRNGNEITASFPEIAASLEALPFDDFVVDGEVVVHDDRGIPSFQRLQQRAQLRRAPDIARAAVATPATLYLFDALGFAGRDLRPLPLIDRKDVLRMLLPPAGALRFSDHIPEQGEEMFERVTAMGLEGVIAKRADAPYRGGRSRDWLKIRADLVDDFVVVGWTEPKGARSGFGALHLGAYDGDRLVYAGRVGSGFNDAQLAAVEGALREAEVKEPPAEGSPKGREHHWAPPALIAEVRYREATEEGLLRHPVFVRFRDDKAPEECVRRVPGQPLPVEVEAAEAPEREVRVTNAAKVFWPENGYTKGDMVAFYEAIAPWMLPYLADRPLVLTRFPDGIHGKSFYQKDAPDWAPDWLRTVTVWSEGSERDLDYFVCDSVESLLWVANSASIPMHVWHSRVGSLERPDWCVIDLDPKEAPFEDVIAVARVLHDLCDEIGLDHYVKTSGSSGLHVLVPLARKFTHEQSRILGHLLSQVVVAELPDIATLQRVIDRRGGRVYLDYLQNGHGKLIVAPFSVRPKPGAPVSAPLYWEEVKPGLAILDFTIANTVARMEALGEDPLAGVLEAEPDLAGALGRLQERLS